MNLIKCIRASIYRAVSADCSNGGISAHYGTVLIPQEEGPVEVDMDDPPDNLCRVVSRASIDGTPNVCLEPHGAGNRWAMFGGTFVYTSDARFGEAVDNGGHPVKLMDRFED